MFEFLLAFSDEKRKVMRPYPGSQVEEASFSKYSFIIPNGGKASFNDDFIFSTNGSYALSNKKEALWQTTTQTFSGGGFGNPQDPKTLMMYWSMMLSYGYPLAGKVIRLLQGSQSQIPPEVEQALAQNPELLQQVVSVIQAKQKISQDNQTRSAQEAAAIIDPANQPLVSPGTDNDIPGAKESKAAEKAGAEKTVKGGSKA